MRSFVRGTKKDPHPEPVEGRTSPLPVACRCNSSHRENALRSIDAFNTPAPGGATMESPASAQALPEIVAADARVYLSPAALGPLTALSPMVAAGNALPLAGGPLAFAA